MIYAALLRGINVGGNNKVDMKRLKAVFERCGVRTVQTYINSGNVIFEENRHTTAALTGILERAVKEEFGFPLKILLRDMDSMAAVAEALPADWRNDSTMKCDVMFLWESTDRPEILKQLTIKPGIDDVRTVPGAILWAVDRKEVTRSGMMKIAGTDLYRRMTIRNCNTVRKLFELMGSLAAMS